jgi:hypothetical protein
MCDRAGVLSCVAVSLLVPVAGACALAFAYAVWYVPICGCAYVCVRVCARAHVSVRVCVSVRMCDMCDVRHYVLLVSACLWLHGKEWLASTWQVHADHGDRL